MAAGWPFEERGGGRLAVRLDVPHGVYKALVDTRSEHEVRVAAQMARFESLTSVQREAVATFLLQANAWIRFARAAAQVTAHGNHGESPGREDPLKAFSSDPAATAICEVCFANLPLANEIEHALSALSVACSLCARELDALRDPQTARVFLNVQGAHAHHPPGIVEEGSHSSIHT
jgi:hypothetical protein